MEENEFLSKYKNGWFACRVTTGFERKVYRELSKLLTHDHWSKYIYDMFLPMEIVIDKKGKEKAEILEAYKGVIYIKMNLTPDVYNVIKIEGFRTPLPAKDPIRVPEAQMEKVLKYRLDLDNL